MTSDADSAATEPTARAHKPVRPSQLCPNVVQGERAERSGAQGSSDADAGEAEEPEREASVLYEDEALYN